MLNLLRRILFGLSCANRRDYPPIVDEDPHARARDSNCMALVLMPPRTVRTNTLRHGKCGAWSCTAYGHGLAGHAVAGRSWSGSGPEFPRDIGRRSCRLALFVLWIGLVPADFLRPIAPAVEQIAGPIDAFINRDYAKPRQTAAALPGTRSATASRLTGDRKPWQTAAALPAPVLLTPAVNLADEPRSASVSHEPVPTKSVAGPLAASTRQ